MTPARLAALKDAAALYRGPLAEGAGYDWAEPYAETARRRALDTWTAIAELLEPADPDQALAALDTALSHDPYNEYLYQRIMRIQAAAGRPEAVRRTLRLLETRLTELGLTPAAQTRQAAATLLGMPAPPQRSGPQPPLPPQPAPPAPAPARPPPRPVTRSPARLRGARIPPADSKPRPEPRYHDHTPGRAIHCPEAFFPGAVTRRRSGQAGDPAGVPFRQLIRIPSGVPADTGNPCPAPFRRHRPIRTFRRTPRLIQHQACKTIWGRRAGDNQVRLMAVSDVPGLLLICPLTFRRPPRARPRGARPPARPGEAGGEAGEAGQGDVARARLGAGEAARGEAARGRPALARADGGTPDGNRIDANCACGLPFERTTGPRWPARIHRPFTAFTFEFPPEKAGNLS